jgi:hypothetical protein
MAKPQLHLPGDTERLVVVGRTGSGKTQGALWQLSQRSIDRIPWVIVDTKRDSLIRDVPYVEDLDLSDRLPRYPGLYRVTALPKVDDEALEGFLWSVHAHGRTGLFIDEGYMVPETGALQGILTQGRSLRIPLIVLVQRPNNVSRFIFSESEYIQLYKLTDNRDVKIAKDYMGQTPLWRSLPGKYYSWWWDNQREQTLILRPVPDRNTILDIFYNRLRRPKRVL